MLLFDGIIAGDIVKAYNHETEKVTFAKVKRTFKSEWNRIVHLFYGDKRISCTPGHKFWLPEKGKYMAADSLMRGVKVLTLAVGLMSLDSVAYADTIYTAYNFEVEDHHNYFVGEDGVLVHNHCALPRANISDELFEQIFPASKYTADELAAIRNKLGRDLMPNGSNSPPNAFFDYINLAPNDVVRAKRVKAWESVKHLGNVVRLNPTILGKINVIRTSGNIPVEKFDLALKQQFGQILDSADELNANKILDRLQEAHVNDKHFDNLIERLENPDYVHGLVKDLKNNPDWFETFDDIIHHPGKYWDILEDGSTPASASLAKWGQGHWWKNLRGKASNFEVYDPLKPSITGAAQKKLAEELGVNVDNIGTQITVEVNGKRTRLDYMAKGGNGKINLGEAKFSTKDKDWESSWLESTTSKQADAFPDLISRNYDIEIKVSDPDKIVFIEEVLGITKNSDGKYIIPKENIDSFKLLGSAEDNASIVKSVVDLID